MADGLDGAFSRAVELVHGLKGQLVCTGVGKSGHVARKISATLASTGTPSVFVHATEASHGDLGIVRQEDAVLALSKSGETKELADVVAYAKRFGIPLIGMTAVAGSALGKASDVLLELPAAPEAAEGVDAPTTSTTLQIALGDALAVALVERRGFTAGDFKVFHPGGKLGSLLRTVADLMHRGAEVPTVPPDAAMPDALLVMTEKHFGCVGVTDGGRLAGMITDGDLRRHMDGLLTHTAGEVMTRGPLTVSPGMLAGEALKLMNDRGVTVLFVVDETQAPVGILHVHDLLRAGVL
ncbi:MAG: KpsF/GutQ family sugar-phosphate isomerase [Caulobacteraceae bacterium]|nr:KpsF/GutQ family sugar-phosphate isomerase [Caulobacteraceae bacterium]